MKKRVFISYAWGTKEHEDWVISLGKRLMDNTIDVVLDKWSLKDGHDKYEFMEQMVKSDDIFRVLLICDKKYSEKADGRKGGVGTETQIITSKIYNDTNQEKFVALVLEKDENGVAILPTFVSTRKYIDFSEDEYFETSYEELLRNIFEKPAYPKPKLGTHIPKYITEEEINNTTTHSSLRTLKNQINKKPEKVNTYSIDFIEKFLEILWEFEIKKKSSDIKDFGVALIENLKSFQDVKQDFTDFIEFVTKTELELDVDILIDFFEKAPIFKRPRKDSNKPVYEGDFENFKMIFHELYIYTVCIGLKNKNYNLIGSLLHTKYYFDDDYLRTQEPKRYCYLYYFPKFLQKYNDLHERRLISPFGDYMVNHLTSNVNKEDFVFSETLLHYIGRIYGDKNDYQDRWFPHSYLYSKTQGQFPFLKKLSSYRFFHKIKPIFNVSSKEEFIKTLKDYKNSINVNEDRHRFSRGFESISYIFEIIPPDKIGVDY